MSFDSFALRSLRTPLLWCAAGLAVLSLAACSLTGGDSTEGGEASPELVAFRDCVVESGAIFYGTEWCPHCQTQREILGGYEHTDCDRYKSVCRDEQIQAYPTWVFADGSRAEGVQSLDALAEATGCPLDESLRTPEEPEEDAGTEDESAEADETSAEDSAEADTPETADADTDTETADEQVAEEESNS